MLSMVALLDTFPITKTKKHLTKKPKEGGASFVLQFVRDYSSLWGKHNSQK